MNLINKKDLRNLQIRKLTEFGKTQQKQLEDESYLKADYYIK